MEYNKFRKVNPNSPFEILRKGNGVIKGWEQVTAFNFFKMIAKFKYNLIKGNHLIWALKYLLLKAKNDEEIIGVVNNKDKWQEIFGADHDQWVPMLKAYDLLVKSFNRVEILQDRMNFTRNRGFKKTSKEKWSFRLDYQAKKIEIATELLHLYIKTYPAPSRKQYVMILEVGILPEKPMLKGQKQAELIDWWITVCRVCFDKHSSGQEMLSPEMVSKSFLQHCEDLEGLGRGVTAEDSEETMDFEF